jgi:hypothetical protein
MAKMPYFLMLAIISALAGAIVALLIRPLRTILRG